MIPPMGQEGLPRRCARLDCRQRESRHDGQQVRSRSLPLHGPDARLARADREPAAPGDPQELLPSRPPRRREHVRGDHRARHDGRRSGLSRDLGRQPVPGEGAPGGVRLLFVDRRDRAVELGRPGRGGRLGHRRRNVVPPDVDRRRAGQGRARGPQGRRALPRPFAAGVHLALRRERPAQGRASLRGQVDAQDRGDRPGPVHDRGAGARNPPRMPGRARGPWLSPTEIAFPKRRSCASHGSESGSPANRAAGEEFPCRCAK